ncbi:hypothetical protein tb265_31590 [Gemmatimonadetes bacterium T265]|nr:hypothetical protein tb265_31590 [Gemmatimonadetes bacterium T265]
MSARPALVPAPPTARPLPSGAARNAYAPRVILHRALARDDRVAAAATGVAAGLAVGLATFYLTTLWRARDPR